MSFKDLMEKRYSARDFKEDSIPDEDLCEIVKTASMSPSWGNTQPWNVHIATGKSLDKIREAWISKNADEIPGDSDLPTGHREDFGMRALKNMANLVETIGENPEIQKEFRAAQPILFNAPAIAYITMPKTSPMWSVYDLGAFSMSLMLAASEKDIDSIPAYELVKYLEILRENMQISDDESIIAGIALSYASDSKLNDFRAEKLDVDEILKIYK